MSNTSRAQSTRQSNSNAPSRSLLRLVLLGFLVAILPILVLIYRAGHDISMLSSHGEITARQSVNDTRRARTLVNMGYEIERIIRQYAVVQNTSLLQTYRDRVVQFNSIYAEQMKHIHTFDHKDDVGNAIRQMQDFAQTPTNVQSVLSLFPALNNQLYALEILTNTQVDNYLQNMRLRAQMTYSALWILLAITLSLTLAAIIFFTWRITRPIQQLESRILSLGTNRRTDRGEIKGPAEFSHLGHRLDWLGDRLDELEAQKRQFLRHMSHELKTPLAAIREGAGLLEEGIVGELTERQREIIILIDNSSAELQIMIEQLLDYNRVQQNQMLTITRFDVVTLVHEIINKHRLALEGKQQMLEVPRRPVYWQADRIRMTRVIDNLISNVVAYGDDQGLLRVRVWTDEHSLYLEVGNSGDPIAKDDGEHLFEPFYQGSSTRKGPLKGSGIGLSVAAECAQIQGGTLELVEEAEEDVCFRLTLPKAELGEQATSQGNLEVRAT